jgi:protein-S-isoprenylcysteine O-methyltransferase Ste14
LGFLRALPLNFFLSLLAMIIMSGAYQLDEYWPFILPGWLVAVGPYRWARNPIYAGDVLLVFGVAFFTRSPSALVIAILLLPLLHWYVWKIEEPRAKARLGDAFREYKQSVPGWFPKLRKIDE